MQADIVKLMKAVVSQRKYIDALEEEKNSTGLATIKESHQSFMMESSNVDSRVVVGLQKELERQVLENHGLRERIQELEKNVREQ